MLAQDTPNVTWLPGIAPEGTTDATVLAGALLTAAAASGMRAVNPAKVRMTRAPRALRPIAARALRLSAANAPRPGCSQPDAADRLFRCISVSSPEDRQAPRPTRPGKRACHRGGGKRKAGDPPYCYGGIPAGETGKRAAVRQAWQDRQHAALANGRRIARAGPGRGLRRRACRSRSHRGRHRPCAGTAAGRLRPGGPDEVRAGRG